METEQHRKSGFPQNVFLNGDELGIAKSFVSFGFTVHFGLTTGKTQ